MGVFKSKEEKKALADERDAKYLAKLAKTNKPKTDREIQESIAKNIRAVTRYSKSISGWMTFIGIVMILNIIGAIYIVSQM